MLLQCPDAAFRTAVAFRFAHKGRRTGDTHKRQCLLQHMCHLWTAMLMTECHTLGDALLKSPPVGADPLTDGLQGFTPGPLRGRVDTHTLR